MRLPLSKVYRAFPELDKFDDQRCEAFVKNAEKSNRAARAAVMLATFLCFLPGGCIGGGVMIALSRLVVGELQQFDLRVVASIAFLTLGVGGPCVGGLMIRDFWLRRTIRKQLRTCSCPACHYSLLGLRPAGGSVVCPECGGKHLLSDMGLTSEDILAPSADTLPA